MRILFGIEDLATTDHAIEQPNGRGWTIEPQLPEGGWLRVDEFSNDRFVVWVRLVPGEAR